MELSAISQNRPVIIEINGIKTSHFKESKTAPRDREEIGSMEHVECPHSEPANNDIQLGAARLVAAANCQGAGVNRETVGRYLRLSKPANFDHRLPLHLFRFGLDLENTPHKHSNCILHLIAVRSYLAPIA
jgi:hypothetical protein